MHNITKHYHFPHNSYLLSMASLVKASIGKIRPASSVLMVCDIQERFKSVIHNWSNMVTVSKTMMDAANTMKIAESVNILLCHLTPPSLSSYKEYFLNKNAARHHPNR